MRAETIAITALVAFGLSGCDRLGWPVSSTSKPKSPELQLDYSILLDGAPPRRISEKYQFQSGDRFRLEVRPAFAGWVYLFSRGAGQKEYLCLYPNQDAQRGKALISGQTVTLPGGDNWYTLDDSPGSEAMVLVASAMPIADLGPSVPLAQDDFEERIAKLERERRPRTAKRVEEAGWTKLFVSHDDAAAMVMRISIDHK